MLITINQELLHLKEELREYHKLLSLEKSKAEDLEKKNSQRMELKEVLDKERKDVEKLEGLSMSAVLLTLVGKKYEKLDKEKEEYLLATLKYEELEKQIKKLEMEIKNIRGDLAKFDNIDQRYKNLIKEKENLIIKEGGSSGIGLKNSLVKIDEIQIDIKEIKEAINAGETTLNALEKVREKLATAKGWGTWDLLGGGIISDIAKHSAIDKANVIAVEVQEHLLVFKKELSDVNEFTQIQVNLSSFVSFADFFLDGIFADWFVQSKINSSLDNVHSTIGKIEEIISGLEQNLIHLENQMEEEILETKRILEV